MKIKNNLILISWQKTFEFTKYHFKDIKRLIYRVGFMQVDIFYGF